jgi:hypothetical protein
MLMKLVFLFFFFYFYVMGNETALLSCDVGSLLLWCLLPRKEKYDYIIYGERNVRGTSVLNQKKISFPFYFLSKLGNNYRDSF